MFASLEDVCQSGGRTRQNEHAVNFESVKRPLDILKATDGKVLLQYTGTLEIPMEL